MSETIFREDPLSGAVLVLADTKLVLGNWYAECVLNGRSLPDFAALLGMSAASYGHARALYQWLARHGHDYDWLERGRGAAEIHSMEMLDTAPRNWEDFIATVWLAETAIWVLGAGISGGGDRSLAATMRRIGEELYFHAHYARGWLRIFSATPERTRVFQESLASRARLAALWFDARPGSSARRPGFQAHDDKLGLRERFFRQLNQTLGDLGLAYEPQLGAHADIFAPDWREVARRHGPLPARLFEVIRFKHPELAS